jgi:hypothetical protein
VDEIAGKDQGPVYPENGVAIHVVATEGHWCDMAPLLELIATAPNAD